jgi:peptidoglycan/LPS O-acetylase OafA/YrhL
MRSGGDSTSSHLPVLDGWRAVSITLVLAGHLLPLGPAGLQLNAAAATSGMAIFFTLSGYLITSLLMRNSSVKPFLIRRLFRIVPLAWLAMLILALTGQPSGRRLAENLLFFANLPPPTLLAGGSHLWSLCVEVQFYATVALLVGLLGRRGLYLLPLLAVSVTLIRIAANQPIGIVTWYRVDEILAGGCVALALTSQKFQAIRVPQEWLTLVFLVLLFASSHPVLISGLGYLRPYFAAAAVGASLLAAPAWLKRALESEPARYVAQTSYALYVIHGMLAASWLGGEGKPALTKYMLRVPLLLATFGLAHLSTFHFEARAISLGKRLLRQES